MSGLIRWVWMSQRVDGSRCPGPSLAASVLSHSLSLSLLLSLFMKDKDTAIVRDSIPVIGTHEFRCLRTLPWRAGRSSKCGVKASARHECLLDVRVRQAVPDRSAGIGVRAAGGLLAVTFLPGCRVRPRRRQRVPLQAHDLSAGTDAHRSRGDALRHRGNRGRDHLTDFVPGPAGRRRPGASRQRGEQRRARRLLARLCARITARATGAAAWLRRWAWVSAAGGAVGAVLLLSTPPGAFGRVVPFLVAAGSSPCSSSPGSPPCASRWSRNQAASPRWVAVGVRLQRLLRSRSGRDDPQPAAVHRRPAHRYGQRP